jgi:hypothetical protein
VTSNAEVRKDGIFQFVRLQDEACGTGTILAMRHFSIRQMVKMKKKLHGSGKKIFEKRCTVFEGIEGSTKLDDVIQKWFVGKDTVLNLHGDNIESSTTLFRDGRLVCGEWKFRNGDSLIGMVNESGKGIRGSAVIASSGQVIQGEFDKTFLQTQESASLWSKIQDVTGSEIYDRYSCPIMFTEMMFPYLWMVDQRSYNASSIAGMMLNAQKPIESNQEGEESFVNVSSDDEEDFDDLDNDESYISNLWHKRGSAYVFNRTLSDMMKSEISTKKTTKRAAPLPAPVRLGESSGQTDGPGKNTKRPRQP